MSANDMHRAFDPWVGDTYSTGGLSGVRLLILGESQYDTTRPSGWTGEPTDNCRDSVRKEVLDQAIRVRARFWTRVAKLVLGVPTGVWLSDAERVAFWQAVAFHNYIQWWMTGPRVRPSEAAWQAAPQALLGVLDELKPDVMLVLGKELGARLPKLPEPLPVVRVNHPSSRGFSYANWSGVIASDLRAAREKLGRP